MIAPHDSLLVRTLTRVLIPLIQLYSLYILFHAQYSPGGGFVAGVLFGTSLILSVLVFGTRQSGSFLSWIAYHADGLGLMTFAGVGLLCILWGGEFLNYAAVWIPGLDAASRRSLGIVISQVGVAIDVAAVALGIFFNLSDRETGGPALD